MSTFTGFELVRKRSIGDTGCQFFRNSFDLPDANNAIHNLTSVAFFGPVQFIVYTELFAVLYRQGPVRVAISNNAKAGFFPLRGTEWLVLSFSVVSETS